MCWAFDVSIAILTPFTRRASQHASRTHLSHAAREGTMEGTRGRARVTRRGTGDGGDGRAPAGSFENRSTESRSSAPPGSLRAFALPWTYF